MAVSLAGTTETWKNIILKSIDHEATFVTYHGAIGLVLSKSPRRGLATVTDATNVAYEY